MATDPVQQAIDPVDPERCANCPPERVCAWDCEQGQGVLEILMGEALAEEAKLYWRAETKEIEPANQALYEIYT